MPLLLCFVCVVDGCRVNVLLFVFGSLRLCLLFLVCVAVCVFMIDLIVVCGLCV